MRIVVTGAAGLVGGVVFDRLVVDGHDVVGVDRPHDEWLEAGRNIEDSAAPSRVSIHLDLAEATDDDWLDIFRDCEVVVHLAADANPSNSDESMLRNNVMVSTNLMRNAIRSGVRRVILASSGLAQVGLENELAEGGSLEGEMIGVRHGTATTSTYGESKVYVERLGSKMALEHDIEVIVTRIGTVIHNEAEHWERGGRLQATAFLQVDVAEYHSKAVSADILSWNPQSCEGHPIIPGYLLTAAQSNSPGRFIDLEPGLSALGWKPVRWPTSPEDLP